MTNPTIAGTTKITSVIDAWRRPNARSMSGAPIVGAPEASSSRSAMTYRSPAIESRTAGQRAMRDRTDRAAVQMRSVNVRAMAAW
jgi:hypothetical protein